MEIPPYIRESLKELGFTEYETSIYLTLVTYGPMNAKELSKKSGVPYSRIYQILQNLFERSFVFRDEDARPTIFKAAPPSDALERARRKLVENVNNKARSLFDLLNPLYLMKSIPQKFEIFHIEGTEQCLIQIEKLIKLTKSSLYISSSDITILDDIIEKVELLRRKGISNIKILLERSIRTKKGRTDLVKRFLKVGEVREASTIFGTMIVSDKNSMFLLYKKFILEMNSYAGIFSENVVLGPLANEYFHQLFINSKPVPQEEIDDK
ncbi:MAG: TrmB family transcriptional regulator [Promethearchaeota archaeon]